MVQGYKKEVLMEFMRRTITQIGLVLILVFASVGSAHAATNAYDAKYVTSISYMNVGSVDANLNLTFYNADSTCVTACTVNYQVLDTDGSARVIPSMASASLAVSTVGDLSSTQKYGAVVTSNQPLIATIMQVANDSIIGTKPISSGFLSTDASSTIVLPSVMKSCFTDDLTTRFSVQNASASTLTDVELKLIWPNGDEVTPTTTLASLAPGDAQYFDMATVSVGSAPAGVTLPTGCGFNGSAVISSATGSLVATAVELSNVNKYGNSFEGLPGSATDGALTLYMPSAMCRVNYGDGEQSTSYAIQNLTSTTANIDVAFRYQIRSSTGALGAVQTRTLSLAIPAKSKGSVPGCDTSKNTVGNTNTATGNAMPAAAVGSAIITSDKKIVGLQKVSGGGISSATPAIIAGGSTVYTPFVRYSVNCFSARPTAATCRDESRQRTLFAIQNIGGVAAKIKMTLYNYKGEIVGTYITPSTVAAGDKISLIPTQATLAAGHVAAELNEFGYTYVSGNVIYSGSAVFQSLDTAGTTATSTIAVVARVLSMSPLGQTGDDYNGTPQ